MRIALAQLNPVAGDLAGNLAQALEVLPQAQAQGAGLTVFSELYLTGYPPRDLLASQTFRQAICQRLGELVEASREYPEMGILMGVPIAHNDSAGHGLYNGAVLIAGGMPLARWTKTRLADYDIFDESRSLDPGPRLLRHRYGGERLGVTIGETAWGQPPVSPDLPLPQPSPLTQQAAAGATVLINLAASPFAEGMSVQRWASFSSLARTQGRPVIMVNQVGGHDELIFDGRSLAFDQAGRPLAVLPAFTSGLVTVDTTATGNPELYEPGEPIAELCEALVSGLRDYMKKSGFQRVFIGLSGGIDSAVVAALAVRAIGAENVTGLTMPSRYSSPGSVTDALRQAEKLGFPCHQIAIDPVFTAYEEVLHELFAGTSPGVAEENLQSRIRGNLLMALANQYGGIVLPTSNKSELAVGYCTLYGDMSGGLSVLADVLKGRVYELAHYLNRNDEVIPPDCLTKPPSAELRPDQTDQDSLPPYPILDQIIELYVEQQQTADQIIAHGLAPEVVHWVIETIERNEYKRRQAPFSLRVSRKAFGLGRRRPLVAPPL